MLPLRRRVLEQPLLSGEIMTAALAEAARAPNRVVRVLFMLLESRGVRILAKNLLVLPKGLWLSRYARHLGAEHIHAHWASTSSTLALIAAEVSGVPWSFTAHRWDIGEDNLLSLKLRKACFARAISERGAASLRAHARNRASRIRVIRTGVDVGEQPSQPQAARPLRLVVAANLVEVKGHVYLLRALARLRSDVPVRLDVVGDGPLRAHLEQTTTTLGIRELVTFDGAVSHEDFLRRLRDGAWDVCVLPSIVTSSGEQEGIPVSLLEAMSAAVPVVATSTGAIPELLDDGAGVLVPPEDPEALREALTRLAGDPRARAAIGNRGRARVRSEFDVRRTTERLLAEIRSCGGRRG